MVARFPWLVAFAVIACGSDDGGENAASTPAGKSCHALCDKELQLATDCPSDALGNCKEACDGLIPQLDSACRAKAQAAYDCVAANTTSAACNGGNLPLPETPDQCKAMVSEFVQCAP
ncbi:MAG: hypothetical protein HS104_22460 [Polyangiaceae bacterium]|nr:hypothetical protein [Polyangiaceae bacterium]